MTPSPPILIGLLAVAAAIALAAIWSRARAGAAAGDLARGLVELRRHPRVGAAPQAAHPALQPTAAAIGDLLEDLRALVIRAEERSEILKSLADGPGDVALIGLDAEWTVASFSRGASELTGWAADEMSGRHVEILFAPGEWERLLPKLARRTLREAGFAETGRLLTREGRERTCRLSFGPGGGAQAGTLVVARDLGAEIELERRLRQSEERHRSLVESIRDAVVVLQEGRVVYANPSLARLLGGERGDFNGRPFKELIDARDLLRVVDLLARAERGVAETDEVSCRLARPGTPPIEARLTWAATEYGGRRALYCTIADLSDRVRQERALSDSEARLRSTLEAAADALVVFNVAASGLTLASANRAAITLAGDAGLAPGMTPATLATRFDLPPEALAGLLATAREGRDAAAAGVECGGSVRRAIDLAAAPIGAKNGETIGVIVTLRDVTTRIDAERRLAAEVTDLSAAKHGLESQVGELHESRATLSERNVALERINTELRSLDEMKSNLLANVSHELHTPLVSIKGYTEMILKRKLGPLTPEQERGLQVALKNIDRLIELIDNLLSFARIETGETKLAVEDVALWQLVDEAVDLIGERARRRNIAITTQYESDDLMVRGDRVKLGQVFTNLLTNAVKFNRDGGRITLTARPIAGGFVEVEVNDTGIGIPPEEQEKIFERFYQVEAGPRRRYEGTGIGLAIVRDILRLHGGSIRVESVAGEGATFVFTLPIARRASAAESLPPGQRGRTRD